MPRNTREWAHRKLDMVTGNLETGQCHCLEIIDKYIDQHPEIASPLNDVVQALDIIKPLLTAVKRTI